MLCVQETEGRVKVAKVEFSEHGKNSAIYVKEELKIIIKYFPL